MKRSQTSILLVLALLAGPAFAAEDISKVNGSIHTDAGHVYGDLDTVNGSIKVGDHVQIANAETVNGSIRIGDAARTHDLSTVNGGIRVARKAQVEGGIQTVNGSVFVDRGSVVKEGVETVNGGIGLVATELGQGIKTVNGDITVGIDSHVKGGIDVNKPSFSFSFKPSRKPRIIIGPHAVVDGDLRFERDVTLYVHTSAKIGRVSGAKVQRFSTDVAPAN